VSGAPDKIVVLDTWAVLAYLNGEPAAKEVRQVLRQARKKLVGGLLSLINLGECWYTTERRKGPDAASKRSRSLINSP
jgi:ribonuclease VapC